MNYRLKIAGVLRIEDLANIPVDTANVDYQEYLSWVAGGNVAQPVDPAETAAAAKAAQTRADIVEARVYAKLTALSGMTPLQVRNWVTANVTNLAQAQDAIATLAIAVGILWRDKQ